MGQAESNESAAVKRQAEGGVCDMYKLLDLAGIFHIYIIIQLSFVTYYKHYIYGIDLILYERLQNIPPRKKVCYY